MIKQHDIDYIRTNTDSLGTVLNVDADDLTVYIQDLSELVLDVAAQIKENQSDIVQLEDRLYMLENEG
jgi:uncharacterized protein YqgV (UPF0045/DUF77 family)